jgi:hypothetical protein
MTGVLFGFMTVRRQPARHFPAVTRGHGRGVADGPGGTGQATGRLAIASRMQTAANAGYFQTGPQGRKVSSIIAFAGARSAVKRVVPGTVTENPG